MIRWFCNSHYVSQLAAFFIDARAKRSTVKSCQMFVVLAAIIAYYLFPRETNLNNNNFICQYKRGSHWVIMVWVRTDTQTYTLLKVYMHMHVHSLAPFPLRKEKKETSIMFRIKTIHTLGWYKILDLVMILPQVHLRKPCYDFYFL